jgi:ABC-3C biological conflict system middle component
MADLAEAEPGGYPALTEVELVQNPALGGVLLWRFALGCQGVAQEGTVIPALFLVLPVCFQITLESALHTRRNSGLSLFAARLGETREDLLAIHARALAFRQLTVDSLSVAIDAGLLTLDYQTATVIARARSEPEMSDRIKSMWDAAERFGHWCGSLSLTQIALLLRVDF